MGDFGGSPKFLGAPSSKPPRQNLSFERLSVLLDRDYVHCDFRENRIVGRHPKTTRKFSHRDALCQKRRKRTRLIKSSTLGVIGLGGPTTTGGASGASPNDLDPADGSPGPAEPRAGRTGRNKAKTGVRGPLAVKPEVEIWRQPASSTSRPPFPIRPPIHYGVYLAPLRSYSYENANVTPL